MNKTTATFLTLLTLICISGCASRNTERWIGQPVSNIVAAWGQPTSRFQNRYTWRHLDDRLGHLLESTNYVFITDDRGVVLDCTIQ